jgi:uncharacterized alpha-E superfamily protein
MNPRSLSFQLARIEELTRDLPGGAHPDGVAALTRRTGKLAIELQSFEVTGFETISLAESAAFLDRTIFEMSEISELLTQVFFSHVTPQVN